MLTYSILCGLGLLQVSVIAVWLWQQVLIQGIRRAGQVISDSREAIDESLTVIIPARNEASRIGDTIRHLLAQDYPNMRVIVVDDRSEDATGDVARSAAAGDSRVDFMRVDTLPPDWMGKSHAMWLAAKGVTSDWMLFIDADCHVLPRGLHNAMAYAVAQQADLLSVWPRDGSRGFWERLLLPLCGAMIVIWYGRSTREGGGRVAFANGQFMLFRRDAYWAVEGHRAVRSAIIEDIPLATRLNAEGLRVLSAIGTDVCAVRMYESLRELVRGWQRIYIGVLTPLQTALCMVSIVIGSITPYVVIPICLSRVLRGEGGAWVVFLWLGIAHLIALMATSVRFFSIAKCRLRYLWLYPLSCIGVLVILGGALRRSIGRTSVEWRGTRYEVRRARIEASQRRH